MLSMEKHTELLASILENPEIANVSEMVTQLKRKLCWRNGKYNHN